MAHPGQTDGLISALNDRRSNPFIRTRQRVRYDRRAAFRVGSSALAFLHDGDHIVSGFLKNISDTGVCVALEGMPREADTGSVTVSIPVLLGRHIRCELCWSRNGQGNTFICGLNFLDLPVESTRTLRKRLLLKESLLMSYADEITAKTRDVQVRQSIKGFFLIDVRMALDGLITMDSMVMNGGRDGEISRQCAETLDALADAGHELELIIEDAALIKEVKQRVRTLLGQFLYQSRNFKRGLEKPRGYPGDYKMLEMVYDEHDYSRGLGKYIDRYGLEQPYAVGIRLRKDKMKNILYDFINSSKDEQLNILNLASGACRDITELFNLPMRFAGKVALTCVEQDEEAIQYSKNQLELVDTGTVDVRFVQGNILRLEELAVGADGSYDLVYSIGIADYLQDRMLKKILQDSYRMLKKGGTLVIAYKDKEKHTPLALNWYADWSFVPRNEQELVALIRDAMGADNICVSIDRQDTGIIFFAEITKQQ
ncbi:methyltransferase domain-containing protein [Thermodesulfobacteriota bacterium]